MFGLFHVTKITYSERKNEDFSCFILDKDIHLNVEKTVYKYCMRCLKNTKHVRQSDGGPKVRFACMTCTFTSIWRVKDKRTHEEKIKGKVAGGPPDKRVPGQGPERKDFKG